ncbi:TetR/AcrR family transcriptional regulator [Shouchella patagoniensis]|uniref:TetR/AcrR family transcriptional regulator n=1 Tax=Shouchella patagoniensis TaxID=228576 RepID=UPI000995DBF2|nr:TetR/AcrR family transcriptional regulator [Shouchella patagoniensis]
MSTKNRILEAALVSFASHGYEGTTLAQIASEVGIQKPSLYNHFKSKNELFIILAETIMDALVEEIEKSADNYKDKQLETRLKKVLANSCDFILENHEGIMYKRFMLFPPAELKDSVKAIAKRGDEKIDAVLTDLFQHGQKEGVLKEIPEKMFASSYYCLLDGLFTESFIYDRSDFQRRFQDAWTIFWFGISKEPYAPNE